MSKRFVVAITSVIVCVCSFVFFTRKQKNNLVYIENLGCDIKTLNPTACCDLPSNRVILDIFEGLLDYDKDGNLVPTGCEKYEISDDGLTYKFFLRKNAKWSNGDNVTAEDYIYSFKRSLDPKTLSQSFLEQLFDIKNARPISKGEIDKEELGAYADDTYTLRIELEKPNAEFLYYITLPIYMPIHKKSVEKYGLSAFSKIENIVCNGAYVIKSWTKDNNITLEKNKHYWDKDNVNIEKVKFLAVNDSSVDLNNFRTNNVHMTYAIPPKDSKEYKKEFGDKFKEYSTLTLHRLILNMKKEKFQDIKVRKALSVILDRDKIAKVLFAKPSYTIIPENSYNNEFKDDVNDFEDFDWKNIDMEERINLAKSLLEEAGYNKENPLTIDIYLCTGDIMKKIANTLQDIFTKNLDGLIKCTVSFNDWNTYLENTSRGKFDIMWSCWIADYDTPSDFSMLCYSENNNNYGFYKDADFDYNYKASFASNIEDYINYQRKCNKIATQSYCIIPFMIENRRRLFSDKVEGFLTNALDRIKTKNLKFKKK